MIPPWKSERIARPVLAAFAGALLALSFPNFNAAGLAWAAPGLLLFSAAGNGPGGCFRGGYTGGLVFYLIQLHWLLYIPMAFLPVLGWILLSAYLALYPAAWLCLAWRFAPKSARTPFPWQREAASGLWQAGWLRRAAWTVQCASAWVALEMIVARFLSGFPWDLLGVSQHRLLPLIQIAEFTGVYGVSFLIVWFSASLFLASRALLEQPSARHAWLKELAPPLLVVISLAVLGVWIIRNYPPPKTAVKAALIQPSIPQTLIWDERENATRFAQLLALSEQALETAKPDLLIWPEASVPNMLRHHEETSAAIRALVRKHNVWAILGSDDAERRPGATSLGDVDYYNSAFAVSPDGELAGMYRKRRLVIFGEYIPFVKWLPFLKHLSPAGEAGFTAGDSPSAFQLDSLQVVTSVLICFEDTFPHLVREYARPNVDFLINLTNNGWFGESAAQWQHAATAAFRAIENRIPLVRCANNGLTCWVDPLGVIHEIHFPGGKNIYQTGFKIATIPTLAPDEPRRPTFYTRHGDVFGWACFTFTMVNLALCLVPGRIRPARA